MIFVIKNENLDSSQITSFFNSFPVISLSFSPATMHLRSQRQQQQLPHACCARLSLPRGVGKSAASVAAAVLSHLLFSRGQSPAPLRALTSALEREEEAAKARRSDHFARRSLRKSRALVEGFAAAAAALLASSPCFFSFAPPSPSSSGSDRSASDRATVLILFGPSILRPMEAFEVVLPCSNATTTREEQKKNGHDGDGGVGEGEGEKKTQASLERQVTMQLLQADLPDGAAARAPTKCFVLVRGRRGRAGGGGGGGGEESARRQQQPLSTTSLLSSQQPPPPPPGFLPAAGFSWPRASYARGMLRVRIEVGFYEGREGRENEMEWQQREGATTATATTAAAAGEGAEESGAWWASTAAISGVGGCNGA